MTYFKAKMHQIRFRLGLHGRPRPRWRAYSAPRPPSWIWGPLRGRGGAGLGKRRERGGKGGREGKGGPPSYCWTRAPLSLATPLKKTKGLLLFACLSVCLFISDDWRCFGELPSLISPYLFD